MNLKSVVLAVMTFNFSLLGFAYAEDAEPKTEPAKHHQMKADTNQDGAISFEEFKAMHEKRLQAQFKRMDTNNDGLIDQAERQAIHDKMREMRNKRKAEQEVKPESEKTN